MNRVCSYCQKDLPPGKRKYCSTHSNLASVLWKREHRRLWKQKGEKYWLSDWKSKSHEERKEYFRRYMRNYRRRRSSTDRDQGASEDTPEVRCTGNTGVVENIPASPDPPDEGSEVRGMIAAIRKLHIGGGLRDEKLAAKLLTALGGDS